MSRLAEKPQIDVVARLRDAPSASASTAIPQHFGCEYLVQNGVLGEFA